MAEDRPVATNDPATPGLSTRPPQHGLGVITSSEGES